MASNNIMQQTALHAAAYAERYAAAAQVKRISVSEIGCA
jgi:hypothetical protein